uniref:Uncharacterized protein n=1 Tax=Leptobrachium leishanense TaxID=445787 RepID=A0A8C5PW52_9ANUR
MMGVAVPPSCDTGTPHLQQLHFHPVPDQLDAQPPLPALQVVRGDGEGDLGGVQRPLQAVLLLQEQLGLGSQLADLPAQLGAPEVDVQQPLAQLLGAVRLAALCPGLGLRRQLLGLMPAPLRAVPVRARLVVGGEVRLQPLFQQVLGRTEAGGGQAGGGMLTRVHGFLHTVRLQAADGDTLRCWGPGHEHLSGHGD